MVGTKKDQTTNKEKSHGKGGHVVKNKNKTSAVIVIDVAAPAPGAASLWMGLPAECHSHMASFLDFGSLLSFRATSNKNKTTAEAQLLQRAMATLPMTEKADHMDFGYPRTSEIQLSIGWSDQWATREGVVDKAFEYAALDDKETMSNKELAKHKEKLQRQGTLSYSDPDDDEDHWSTTIVNFMTPQTPLEAWKKIMKKCAIFGLGKVYSDDFLWGEAYFGAGDAAARGQLTPMLQAAFGLLMQASSIVFTGIAFQEETDSQTEDGDTGAILLQTKSGQKVQIALNQTRSAEK